MSHNDEIIKMERPLTYIQIIGLKYPEIEAVCVGDGSDYNSIVVVNGETLPTLTELNASILNDFKEHRIKNLSDLCQQDIISGFVSNGLGYDCLYDSEEIDQLNLIGAVATTAPTTEEPNGYSQYYAVRPIVNSVVQPKAYVQHTNANLRKVLADGAVVKLAKLQKFNTKRYYVNQATTLEAIDAITWESNP